MSLTIHERGGSAGLYGLLTSPPTLLAFIPVTCLPHCVFSATAAHHGSVAQHCGTVQPCPRSWPLAPSAPGCAAPSCCRHMFPALPAHGAVSPRPATSTLSTAPPASLLLCSLITPFSARAATFPPFEMAFFAKDTANLTATIRFAGAQSQNIRSIRAFSAHHSQWQSPASHLPALHDYRRKNEKCRAPSTHGRAVYCPCDTCGTAKCPTVDIGGNMQHPHN